jgi:hypothetical protein
LDVPDGGNSSVRNGGKSERNGVLFLLGQGVGWGVVVFLLITSHFFLFFPPFLAELCFGY